MTDEYFKQRYGGDTSLVGRRKKMVMTYLRDRGEPASAAEIARAVGVDKEVLLAAAGAVTLLVAEGRVGREGHSRNRKFYSDPDISTTLIGMR